MRIQRSFAIDPYPEDSSAKRRPSLLTLLLLRCRLMSARVAGGSFDESEAHANIHAIGDGVFPSSWNLCRRRSARSANRCHTVPAGARVVTRAEFFTIHIGSATGALESGTRDSGNRAGA